MTHSAQIEYEMKSVKNSIRSFMKNTYEKGTAYTLAMAVVCLMVYINPSLARSAEYSSSSLCRGCHTDIYKQHSESMHEKSFTNPVFQSQYFNELLPQIEREPDLRIEAEACTACHSPIAYLKLRKHITSKEQVNPRMSGVTCDICHTITGYTGKRPGNGNFISKPSDIKLGPFKTNSNWHRAYSELHTKSEFCAICHNATNRHGLEIKSTYTEWKNSRYAEEGIQCQDCHMNVEGFLMAGKPAYEAGKAAYMTVGKAPYREKLYTHHFPGAHSRTQVASALTINIETEKSVFAPGDEIIIRILVDNSKTGHKMPSGSADLRLLWIDINAYAGDRIIPVTAEPALESQYDVTGRGVFDQEILGDDIQRGKRIYRAIFVDNAGKQTLSSYNATKIIFDNRLNAAEIRKETFRFKIPEGFEGTLSLTAAMKYLPYPGSFAKRLGLPKPEAVEVAVSKKDIRIQKP